MEESHERKKAAGDQEPIHGASHKPHHTPPARARHARVREGEQADGSALSHVGRPHKPSVLVVGTETAVFKTDSPVRDRILAYTKCFARTEIIVMCGGRFKEEHAAKSVSIYPTNSRLRILRVWDAIRRGRRIAGIDVVTAQDPFETGLAGLLIARKIGARLHVQVHTDPFAARYAAHSITNFIRLHLALYILKKADGIRVVSTRVKEEIERRITPKRPITVLPIFVDVEMIQQAVAPRELINRFSGFKTRLLVVSRLESEKNVALAISSFAKSAPKDACLIIVGDGRERRALETLAQNLGVMGRVFFEGQQNSSPYYTLADLVLVPSEYEGYGLVIIEALGRGVPVLSTDVGIAHEQGALVTTPEKFADTLHEWFMGGPRSMQLVNYPYKDFNEYVDAYCDDIAKAAGLSM